MGCLLNHTSPYTVPSLTGPNTYPVPSLSPAYLTEPATRTCLSEPRMYSVRKREKDRIVR